MSTSVSRPKPWLMIGAAAFVLVLLGVAGYFAYQWWQLKNQVAQPAPTAGQPAVTRGASPVPSPTVAVPADWKTYTDPESGLSFRYPPQLEEMVSSKQSGFTVTPKQETLDYYQKYREGNGCPSTCGQLVEDPALLEKQFTILSQVASAPNCSLSDSLKEEVSSDFILFSHGITSKLAVSGIKTNTGLCGLKLIEYSGFDASLSNYYYKAGFLVGDKVVEMYFTLLPHNAFASMDALWTSLGYDLEEGSCDAACYDKELKYYENFDLQAEEIQEAITTYDQILSTLTFTP
jgi:hypothetical protein